MLLCGQQGAETSWVLEARRDLCINSLFALASFHHQAVQVLSLARLKASVDSRRFAGRRAVRHLCIRTKYTLDLHTSTYLNMSTTFFLMSLQNSCDSSGHPFVGSLFGAASQTGNNPTGPGPTASHHCRGG